MAPDPTPLLCALALPAPSHWDGTTPSPCWAPHFMIQEGLMFLIPNPERATSVSRRDDERLYAVGSHCSLALRLYFAACNLSSSCRVWILNHLCSKCTYHLCSKLWMCVFTYTDKTCIQTYIPTKMYVNIMYIYICPKICNYIYKTSTNCCLFVETRKPILYRVASLCRARTLYAA